MEFETVLEQTLALLQRQGRISYGALKRRFQLDDTYLEDLKVELIEAQRLAYDENGGILVWAGETASQPLARDDQAIQAQLIHVERRTPDAERRQLTVMFCDLVDSTLLASQLDPEDWREVVRAYQETAAAVIQRFDGHIAQYLGDGLLVYFGFPQAHEDDAHRAVRTGLDVVEALGTLNTRLAQPYGVQLTVRMGIHTGLVVIGEMGGGSRQEQLALGDTPNVAARIQGLAAPDTVVISPATFRLVRGFFHSQDLGLQWQRDEAPEAKFDKLERVLRTYRLPLEDSVPLFAVLLALPLPERYPPLNLTPQRQRQKTHEALVAWLLEEAERQPVLAVWEDLHWADPSTIEVLSLTLDQVPIASMLTLLTCRPEFRPPWATYASVAQVTVNRLGRSQVEAMIASLTDDKPLPTEIVEQIIAKTDGVPLFVEELVKMILESGLVQEHTDGYVLAGPLPPLAIPSTLHDSLMARLDRLSTARELVQLGAVLGREFAYELLQAVAPEDEKALQQGLARLVDAELVYQRGLPPRSRYIFKHALIQDAAYQSLLKSTRQQYHQRIAQVLAAQVPEIAETQPELVAHHYTEAGLNAQAMSYWQRAGQQAIERSANLEAVSHLTKGLELLQTLPETPERIRHELTFHIVLGTPLVATKGYGAAEVEQCYTRAWELSQQVGESPQLFPVLGELYRFYLLRAELQTARDLAGQFLSLAQRAQDPALLLEAHRVLWQILAWFGEFPLSRSYLEQGMTLYDTQQHRSHAFLYVRDPGVDCYSYAAWVLWVLGYPDQALKRNNDALTLAHELSHPFSLASALGFASWLHQLRREVQATQEQAEAAMTLSTEEDFPHWLAMGTILRGWALVEQREEGTTQIRQGLAAWRAAGAELARPYYLALLAEAYGKGGQVEEGLSIVAEALATVHHTGERFYEAELYRLQGELLLAQSAHQTTEAEACFHQALDVARRQQAKSLELRAAMSLAHLWQRQGKQHEAHQLLAEVYGWFTEGFDTADLQKAKALLEELA